MENAWKRLDGSYPAVGVITNVNPINGTGTDVEGVAVQWQGELPMSTYQGEHGPGPQVPAGEATTQMVYDLLRKVADKLEVAY